MVQCNATWDPHIWDPTTFVDIDVRALGFLPLHYTGSDIVSSIINRVTDVHQLRSMFPTLERAEGEQTHSQHVTLNWPFHFPGAGHPPAHGMHDVINAPAVFDHGRMSDYLKADAIFFTVMRDPIARSISTFSHQTQSSSWYDYLERMTGAAYPGHHVWGHEWVALNVNSMAYDLGWYQDVWGLGSGTTMYDHDDERIAEFVQYLDGHLDLVLIFEELDKSLVLLGRKARMDVVELAYKSVAISTDSHLPTTDERETLRQLLKVDAAIYDHFRAKLTQTWDEQVRLDPTLNDDLDQLRCLNQQIEYACTVVRGPLCHHAYMADVDTYQRILKHHGGLHTSFFDYWLPQVR